MAAILLVEDDIDVRLLLDHVLSGAGCSVNSVETVKSAKRLLDTQPFDLVVADGSLPDGSGIEIADHAKARGVGALIITGAALQLPRERLVQYTYLLKPLRPAELIEAVRNLLPRRDGESAIVPFSRSS